MLFPRLITLFFLAISLFPRIVVASGRVDSLRPKIEALKIDRDIELSGKLDDPNWKLAQPIEINYEVTPGDNTPAPQRTTVRTVYNSRFIYFGFDCRDTRLSELRAHLTDRDKLWDDDWALVILDTYGDYQRSYEFVVNAYGIQADLLRTGSNEDASFDAVWQSAAAIDSSGWTAEMAIPFKSIRFPSKPDQHWVVEFIRNYPRASRVQTSWVPLDRDNPCFQCQGGIIEGISDVQTAGALDLLPYVVGQEKGSVGDNTNPTSTFSSGRVTGRVGGAVRYAPAPDFAVEATINPDFSQVESDATQISVNSNFALFYSEKRPFFLLGADIFDNRTQTYYSRTINNPIGAARVIGKAGSLSYAYLAASDRNTPYIIPGEETSDYIATDLESFSNVARARYDFGKETFLGGMLTARTTGSAHNFVGGLDWNYKFLENYYFAGELFLSDTKEVNDTTVFSGARSFGSTGYDAKFNGEQYTGTAARVNVQRSGRNYSINAQYFDRSPTFQAQDGFVPGNNTRMAILDQQYTFYPTGDVVDQWTIQLNNGLHYNYDGIRKEKWALPSLFAQLKGQTYITILYFLVNDELYKGVQFDNINRGEISISARPSTYITLFFNGTFGRFIKRSGSPEMGSGHSMNVTAQVRPLARLEVDLSYSRANLSSVATGDLFYDGYIARTTGIYQFSRELFLRVIGQYDEFSRDINLYPLLSYKLSPYTIFYAGSTYTLSDFGEPFGIQKAATQYFVKFQYLIRG
ncbi:MAG TPA: DUF5916 domain-containing protein [Bacteroidota bacterium]|nr:DUF5916 domain-containing protein [Bacteroidota bacterium]